jgi:riboflavin kinase/FMN adenylyltransferase
VKIFLSSKSFPKSIKNPIIALGNFDGVHLAHQKMFQMAGHQAKQLRGTTVAYTFDPHPVKVLSQSSAPAMINTLPQKLELLRGQKLQAVVVEPFDRKFAHLGAREWFEKIIRGRLHAAGVVAGYDFTFGVKRSGTVETLHQLCREFNLHCEILDAQTLGDTLISSSQIRHFISHGEMHRAAELLGQPYFIDGVVIQGVGRGKQIGIPTANLKVENELLPSRGVYACRVKVGLRSYDAVTNIGYNPTFGGESLSVETHLLRFHKKLYGKKLRLFFIKKIREEKPFASAEALVSQIKKDIHTAETLIKLKRRHE